MNHRLCVVDVPGLSLDLLGHVPAGSMLRRWMSARHAARLVPPWPAVTCPVQATLTTGRSPSEHGVIANGVATYRSPADQQLVDTSSFATYRRQVSFWEQSNQFVETPRFWQDSTGRSRFKTALLFFQHCMPGFAGTPKPAADIVITPKPEHSPDGKLSSLLWTEPRDMSARLSEQLGPFPLMNYWGPMADIASSQWIAKAAAWVWTNHHPQLQFVYIPHLDYDLQRFGPDSEAAAKAVADFSTALEPLLDAVLPEGRLILLSEYSMQPVRMCVQPNRLLAAAGLLVTRDTSDGKLVDYEHSRAFALVDHQIAHVYLRDSRDRDEVMGALSSREVEPRDGAQRIAHPRAGEIQLQAADGAWFDYRWWDQPDDAPAFARMVDIHRKPGYDALELFFDPATKGVSQDTACLRGSHGRAGTSDGVVLLEPGDNPPQQVAARDFVRLIEQSFQ